MAIPVSPIPGSFFEWEDNSAISTRMSAEVEQVAPLYAAVITADKGSEDWHVLSGQDWFDMYAVNNVVDFKKHGQPLLQTAMAVNAGAKILCKRVVAENATLANLAVIAYVNAGGTEREVQKTDPATGLPVWQSATQAGVETTDTEDAGLPVMITVTDPPSIKYGYLSAEGCQTKEEVIAAINTAVANETLEEGVTAYPLWIFFDNGRGESKKRIKITPNYQISKNYETYFMYDLDVIEGNKYFPTMHFAINPNLISGDGNISLQYVVNSNSTQISAYQYDDSILEFMDIVMAATGLDLNTAAGMDLLFTKNKKGKQIDGIAVDTENGVDLSIHAGQLLLNGDNGDFGNRPLEAASYGTLVAKAFAGYIPTANERGFVILTAKDGCYDPIIYNTDRYKIDLILDANYPDVVKRAIEQLVTFREDCMYFRDMGLECTTVDIMTTLDVKNMHNKFCTTYCTAYDVIDPYSRKQIPVTMMYHMAQLAVSHMNKLRNAPMAGIKYGFTINDIIPGTIRFIPTICPELNEKDDLADARINYATYIDNQLVIESLYTSQEAYTQLSFSNNVLAVQEVIKAIRTKIPASRYSFIDGDDLTKYKQDVERILEPYIPKFDLLTMEYTADPYYSANKIFFATLAFRFKDFVQTEYFKITALSSESRAANN